MKKKEKVMRKKKFEIKDDDKKMIRLQGSERQSTKRKNNAHDNCVGWEEGRERERGREKFVRRKVCT